MINKTYSWVNDQAQRAAKWLDPLQQKSKPAFEWLIGKTDE